MPALSCIELSQSEQAQLKALVLQVLANGVAGQEFIAPAAPSSTRLLASAACFVTLDVDGELRGCTGSCISELPLWLAVCEYGYSSAFEDNRFEPLTEQELPDLRIKISILSPLQPIKNDGEQNLISTLEPNVDGLLIAHSHRRAVFLPSVWQSLPQPEKFLRELKRKGGWPEDYWDSDLELYRFHTFAF